MPIEKRLREPMVVKLEEVVVAINKMNFVSMSIWSRILLCVFCLSGVTLFGQKADSIPKYKKRVLESIEVDLLSSYYSQMGDRAAVSGGVGTEELTDATATIVVSIPLNADDVLSIDAGVSAYTSASSSNINPFDGGQSADAFVASSGESKSDTWSNINLSYLHNSDDRNKIWSAKLSFANEYDYTSIGFGGSYARLFNEKNTELSLHANAYFDQWSLLYPIEFRPPSSGGDDDDDEDFDISRHTITGTPNYNPVFQPLLGKQRNSYSGGIGLSQILSKNLQGSLALDVISQNGLLSTPFQRVHFGDVENSFIENFHLGDDIERLPDSRFKLAMGGRLNYYVNEIITLRSFYRYYTDDWGIRSNTASLEIPIKMGAITFYPSYRYYQQSAADYFQPYDQHVSVSKYYTSDYDLSAYHSNQLGFGVGYADVLTKMHLGKFGLKSIDLKYYNYARNSSFQSSIFTLGVKFVVD